MTTPGLLVFGPSREARCATASREEATYPLPPGLWCDWYSILLLICPCTTSCNWLKSLLCKNARQRGKIHHRGKKAREPSRLRLGAPRDRIDRLTSPQCLSVWLWWELLLAQRAKGPKSIYKDRGQVILSYHHLRLQHCSVYFPAPSASCPNFPAALPWLASLDSTLH